MAQYEIILPVGETSRLKINVFSIKNYYNLLKAFETQLTQGIREILISRGVPKSSDLVKSIDVGYKNDLFEVLANDYYQALSKGRKPHARKVPIEALIQWIKDKKISYRGSINGAAFAIQQSIYLRGIAGKLYEESVVDFSSTVISDISAEALANWTIYGMIDAIQQLDDGKWITVSTEFRQPKYLFNWKPTDFGVSSGVSVKRLA